MYVVNIVIQSIISLVSPVGIMLLISWLFVSKLGAPTWLYAPIIVIGFLIGFVAMIRFAIQASEGLERLEAQSEKEEKSRRKNKPQ